MNNRYGSTIRPFSGLVAIALLSLSVVGAAKAGMLQAPDGFDDLQLFIQVGTFDPLAPHPVIPNCAGGTCFGDHFLAVDMGRSAAEIEALEENAKQFYQSRFGIDVDAAVSEGRAAFFPFTVDPRVDYRAFVISGTYVPPEGFALNDGGWILMITDEDGFELGGEFEGQTVPYGSMALVGEYQIEVHRGNKIVRRIEHSYRSGSFVIFDDNGVASFGCEIKRGRLDENDFHDLNVGRDGLAQGYAGAPVSAGDGLIRTNVRNVMTFNDEFGGI